MFHHRAEAINKFLTSWKFEPVVISSMGFLLLAILVAAYDPAIIAACLAMIIALSPIWLPVYLAVILWILWIDYIRFLFWFSQDMVLLEVQLPQEVNKNPGAMELFLTSFWNASGEGTMINRAWKGSYRPIWSLEIASNEGRIGYYIHMRRAFRNIIEARLYGQFPEAKITEVDDYVARVPFNLKDYDLFGAEYSKTSPEALPIKTYIDYGLDKDPKEELKIDPLSQILELIGQIGVGEHYWIQIILKPRKNGSEWYAIQKPGDDIYQKKGKEEIENLIKNAAKRVGEIAKDEAAQKQALSRGSALLTQTERERLERIERSMSKLVFEVGMRTVYLAKKENFNAANVSGIIRLFDPFRPQFGDSLYSSVNPTRGTTIFDYPWQDFNDIRKKILKKNVFFQYKNRAYFYVPYDQVPMFMNVEELATIWHFPSSVIQTPGLNRVPSRRAEAPVNLPIG